MKDKRLSLIIAAVLLVVVWLMPTILGALFPNTPTAGFASTGLGYLIRRVSAILLIIYIIMAVTGRFTAKKK